jgi:hypothetical protein
MAWEDTMTADLQALRRTAANVARIYTETSPVMVNAGDVLHLLNIADAARVLAEFAKTAPGRLPSRVQEALAVVDALGVKVPCAVCASPDLCASRGCANEEIELRNASRNAGVTAVRPMRDTKAERERFEAAYEAIPPITPTKETAWRIWNMARAYGLIAAPGVSAGDERQQFEAAMRAKHPEWAFNPDPVFGYHNERTRCAWEGWQAARGVGVPEGGER